MSKEIILYGITIISVIIIAVSIHIIKHSEAKRRTIYYSNITISPELEEFYIALQIWINSGRPKENIWNFEETGLCGNLKIYIQHYKYKDVLIEEQGSIFAARLGNSMYPFGGNDIYKKEFRGGTLYKNEKRLEWVKELSK